MADTSSTDAATDIDNPAADSADQEGPGCLPGCLAAGAILLMIAFISCGLSTWYLYEQRTAMAVATLRGDVIPTLEQSGLPPEEKGRVIEILRDVAVEGDDGKLENWQSSGIMERLYRLPLFEWGDLEIAEALITASPDFSDAERIEAIKQLSRVRRAAELQKVTAVEFDRDVLAELRETVEGQPHPRFRRSATTEELRALVERAKILADRVEVPDQLFDVKLSDIVRREVDAGKTEGGI